MGEKCIDHANFHNSECPDCGEFVDLYGNTEYQFENCCFPDCGCDGARICLAPSGPSDFAQEGNVEGMWTGKTQQQRDARTALVIAADIFRTKRPTGDTP